MANLPSVRRRHDGARRRAQLATSSDPTPPKCRRDAGGGRSGRTRDRRRTGRGRRRARGSRGRPCAASRARRTAASCGRRRACRASGARRTTACCRTGRGRTTTPRRGGRRSAARSRARRGVDEDAQLRAARPLRAEGEAERAAGAGAWRGRSSSSRRRSGAAAAHGRPAAPERTRPLTAAWRPARTFSRLLPGAMSAAIAAWARRGRVIGSAPCPAARRARWLSRARPAPSRRRGRASSGAASYEVDSSLR